MSSIPCPDSLQFSPESQIEPAKPGPIHYVLYRRSILPPDFPERAGIFWSRYLFRRFIAEYHLLLQVLTVLDCLSLHPRVTIQQKPSGRDPNVPPLRPLFYYLHSIPIRQRIGSMFTLSVFPHASGAAITRKEA